jgi:predicted acetyltransferase
MTDFLLSRVTRQNSSHLWETAASLDRRGAIGPQLDPEEYLGLVWRFASGVDLPSDRVQAFEYWLFADGRAVGNCRLRAALIPKLELDGGNISYDIYPSERGRRYGREILKRTLVEARKFKLGSVLLTAAPTNEASIRVILGNGGVQLDRTISPFSGEELLRFEVRL